MLTSLTKRVDMVKKIGNQVKLGIASERKSFIDVISANNHAVKPV